MDNQYGLIADRTSDFFASASRTTEDNSSEIYPKFKWTREVPI